MNETLEIENDQFREKTLIFDFLVERFTGI